MPTKDSEPRDILGALAGIIVGVGMVAVAARQTLGSRRRVPRFDDRPGTSSLADIMRGPLRPRRKPPEAGLPVPAVPPRGPAPLQGGAAVALDVPGE